MSFAVVLDAYCSSLNCTNKEIAERCGISASTLSRYRRGERAPSADSPALDQLVNGIVELLREEGVHPEVQAEAIRMVLQSNLTRRHFLGMSFGARIDAIMSLLKVRNAELALRQNVDPSYISRIRNDQRMPANIDAFADASARLMVRKASDQGQIDELLELIDSSGGAVDSSHVDSDNQADLEELVKGWLLGDNIAASDISVLHRLLGFLNGFDVTSYTSSTVKTDVFDSVAPLGPDECRFYYGRDQVEQAEHAFFSMTAINQLPEVFISSDIPALQMATEPRVFGEHMSQIEALARSGCRINVIHSLERPFVEGVYYLRWWLPLYAIGNTTPHYIRGITNRLFCHVNYYSDASALSYEGVVGHTEEGRCYLTTKEEDLSYYKRKMELILGESESMLDLYREDRDGDAEAFRAFEATCRAQGDGFEVLPGYYDSLRITSFPGNCAIVSVLRDPVIHFVFRHPKFCYTIARMEKR